MASAIRRCETVRGPFGAAMMCAAGPRASGALDAGWAGARFLEPLMGWENVLVLMSLNSVLNMASTGRPRNGQDRMPLWAGWNFAIAVHAQRNFGIAGFVTGSSGVQKTDLYRGAITAWPRGLY